MLAGSLPARSAVVRESFSARRNARAQIAADGSPNRLGRTRALCVLSDSIQLPYLFRRVLRLCSNRPIILLPSVSYLARFLLPVAFRMQRAASQSA